MVEVLRDAVLLQVAEHLAAALPAAGVLAAGGAGGQVLGQLHRREHLDLLPPQVLRVEGDGLLHRGQRHQLQQVVLDDVPGGADAVVVPGPAADADVLGLGDLDVVDVVVVPDRFVQLVGEPQRQQVLHRLLAQVVVDPEHALRREHVVDQRVQLDGRLQVVPERLLDDHPPPFLGVRLAQPRPLQLLAAPPGTRSAGSRSRTRGCRRCRGSGPGRPASRPACRRRRRRRTRPGRTGTPPPGAARPPRRTGFSRTAGRRRGRPWLKSSFAQSRRANPTRAKPGGSSPRFARS